MISLFKKIVPRDYVPYGRSGAFIKYSDSNRRLMEESEAQGYLVGYGEDITLKEFATRVANHNGHASPRDIIDMILDRTATAKTTEDKWDIFLDLFSWMAPEDVLHKIFTKLDL